MTGLYAPVIDGYISGPATTLPGALEDVYGCGNASVARLERDGWRVIIRRAGSSVGPLEHVPSGRMVHRRRTIRARRAWLEVSSDAGSAALLLVAGLPVIVGVIWFMSSLAGAVAGVTP